MKENRILLMDDGTKAEWLIKNSNDTTIENMKNRLDDDIHKVAKRPTLADKEFASNASGIANKFSVTKVLNVIAIPEALEQNSICAKLRQLAK